MGSHLGPLIRVYHDWKKSPSRSTEDPVEKAHQGEMEVVALVSQVVLKRNDEETGEDNWFKWVRLDR